MYGTDTAKRPTQAQEGNEGRDRADEGGGGANHELMFSNKAKQEIKEVKANPRQPNIRLWPQLGQAIMWVEEETRILLKELLTEEISLPRFFCCQLRDF